MSLPAGKYYIGDLGYIFQSQEDWMEFLNNTAFINRHGHEDYQMGELEFQGKQFAWYSTAYGDGCYPTCGQMGLGKSLPVDSGTIGCFPISSEETGEEEKYQYGMVITFDEEFETDEVDGEIKFGDIYIPTAEDAEEEEEYPYGYEEEEEGIED